MKLAIISTHPIQYYAPVFKLLATKVELRVFYTAGGKSFNKFDPGFKKNIEWDIPLLDGYNYEYLSNTAKDPGSHHFNGIINPDAIPRIKSFSPDALLVYGWSFHSHLKIIRHFKHKLPVWFRGDSTLIDEKKGIRNLLKTMFLKWVYQHVDKAFYVGAGSKQYFLKYGLGGDQLVFAPHAVDNNRFSEDREQEASRLRSALGVEEGELLFLFSGKFEGKKDPLLLVSAFSGLSLANIHLLMVGNGNLEEQLKNASHKLKNIHFLDFQNQSQMPVIYKACDVYCLPSRGPGETWGLAVNEAMAAARPVLVSNRVGCAVDLVVDKVNGFIFQAGNLEDLKLKMERFVVNRGDVRKMGLESFSKIQDWSIAAQVECFLSELKKLESIQ